MFLSDNLNEMIGYQVQGTAEWRRRKAEEFPDDLRNTRAAEELERLAAEIDTHEGSEMGEQIREAHDRINTARDADNAWGDISEALSAELRSIGFHGTYSTGTELLEWYRDLLRGKLQDIAGPSAKTREDRLRRALAKNGYRLCKTPARSWLRSYYDPGYMVLDYSNTVVLGCASRAYEATLEQVEKFAQSGIGRNSS